MLSSLDNKKVILIGSMVNSNSDPYKVTHTKIYSLNSNSSVWIEIAMSIPKTPRPSIFRATTDLFSKICGKKKHIQLLDDASNGRLACRLRDRN